MQEKGLRKSKLRNSQNQLEINLRHYNIDLILISETKLDDSFRIAQFQVKGFSVQYRCDRNGKGGGLHLYIRENMQSRLLISKSKCNIEILSVAVNLRKRKWFLNCSYNPHQNLISNHFECLNHLIDKHGNSFDIHPVLI